ncbi:MAG: type II toxin-antitoxin system PemK/MazF family toxin [Erysipelotrichaceae bacterium]|nr:type II toxin-antitoxin system PemK/MazF family toxin [Erysipelotrichaceae bacterium]
MRFLNKRKVNEKTKTIFASISNNLSSLDEELALEYLSWLDKKTLYLKKTYFKEGYKAQPDNLTRGDIVWCEFGINVGAELSDYKTKGHYALVWVIDLGNVVVIPLTSQKPNGNELSFDIGVIEGLNDKETHSYLKLDAIRSVSKRRIGRINNKEYGKVSLNEEKINQIKNIISKTFID